MPSKLVRDRIIEIIKSRGEEPQFHVADAAEYHTRLRDKLREEVEEFIASDNPEEIADIFEVLLALTAEINQTWPQIKTLTDQKRQARGAFQDRLVLDT